MAVRVYGPNQTAGVQITTTGKGNITNDGLTAFAEAVVLFDADTGLPVPGGSPSSPSSVVVAGLTYTDISGTITTGGTAQVLRAADADGVEVFIGNPGVASLWVNDLGGTATPNAAGSTEIPAGVTVKTRSRSAISIYGATTAQVFTAGAA